MRNIKSQMSVIEIIYLMLVFGLVSSYIFFDFEIIDKEYKLTLDTTIDSIYYSENFRNIIINEDLEIEGVQEDWNDLELLLDDMLYSYEFEIRNSNSYEKIFTCSEINNKIFTERILFVDSNNNSEYRIIKLGVCY